MKSAREEREAMDESALHDHNHRVGGNLSQTHDGNEALDYSSVMPRIGLESSVWIIHHIDTIQTEILTWCQG